MIQIFRILVGSLFAVAAFTSTSAQAEPSLVDILPGYTDSSFSSFSAGTKLTFTFTSESTDWSPYQTFSITDGANSVLVFSGADTPASPSYSYTVGTLFSGFSFGETNASGDFAFDKSKVLFNTSTGAFAFAHEDWTDNDYNDMVITATVSAVPEPESYAMMLSGLGLIGFMMSRRRG